MNINIQKPIQTLLNFTPALSNLWEFEFEISPNSGFDGGAKNILENLKYCISSIDIEGWSFKYDYIPAFQENVLIGVNRPTKITMTLTDTKRLGMLDSFINLVQNRIFFQDNSTFRLGANGKIIGNFIIKIINPYYKGSLIEYYFPLQDEPIGEEFISFVITCENVCLGKTPPIVLTRTESEPMTYMFDFYCDFMEYVSNIPETTPERLSLKTLELNHKKEPYTTTPRQSTTGAGVPSIPIVVSNKFKKFLDVTTPVFSNMFLVDFNFGSDSLMLPFNNRHRLNGIFNDMIIENVTIDGYTIDYTFNEAILKNLPTKINRPLNISFSIIDNNELSFLTDLNIIIKERYYSYREGCFRQYPSGKNMEAIFVMYSKNSDGLAELEYLIYAEGMKIARMPTLSLNYTNSEVIRYTVDMVCDNITYFNKKEIERNSGLNERVNNLLT